MMDGAELSSTSAGHHRSYGAPRGMDLETRSRPGPKFPAVLSVKAVVMFISIFAAVNVCLLYIELPSALTGNLSTGRVNDADLEAQKLALQSALDRANDLVKTLEKRAQATATGRGLMKRPTARPTNAPPTETLLELQEAPLVNMDRTHEHHCIVGTVNTAEVVERSEAAQAGLLEIKLDRGIQGLLESRTERMEKKKAIEDHLADIENIHAMTWEEEESLRGQISELDHQIDVLQLNIDSVDNDSLTELLEGWAKERLRDAMAHVADTGKYTVVLRHDAVAYAGSSRDVTAEVAARIDFTAGLEQGGDVGKGDNIPPENSHEAQSESQDPTTSDHQEHPSHQESIDAEIEDIEGHLSHDDA